MQKQFQIESKFLCKNLNCQNRLKFIHFQLLFDFNFYQFYRVQVFALFFQHCSHSFSYNLHLRNLENFSFNFDSQNCIIIINSCNFILTDIIFQFSSHSLLPLLFKPLLHQQNLIDLKQYFLHIRHLPSKLVSLLLRIILIHFYFLDLSYYYCDNFLLFH